MNNFTIILTITLVTVKAYSQGSNWEVVPLPTKSSVEILAQSHDGILFGRNTNNLENVYSVDAGITWSNLNHKPVLQKENNFTIGYNKDLFVYYGQTIYKYNLATRKVDTIVLPSDKYISKYFPTQKSFDIALMPNSQILKIYRDSVGVLYNSGGMKWMGISAYSNSIYAIFYSFNRYNLYRIEDDGTMKKIRELPDISGQFFLYKNTIIKNTTYTDDEGKTWQQFNLPFAEPDMITTFKDRLAFIKGNQLYYKEDNQTTFTILDLPSDIITSNILTGQYIVIQNKSEKVENPKILRGTNGPFVSIEFDLATNKTNGFLPLQNGTLLATDENNLVYRKEGNSNTWYPINQSVGTRLFWAEQTNLSVNNSGILSLINKDLKLYISKDNGNTWVHQPEFDSLQHYILKQELQNGTYIIGKNELYLKSQQSDAWEVVDTFTVNYYLGFTSNADVIYTELLGAEIVFSDNIRKDNFFRIVDIPYYAYQLYPHYEMNYMFNSYSLKSYDNGATFEKIDPVIPSGSYYNRVYSLRTGHFLLMDLKKAYLSEDYCKSWRELDLELDQNDRIDGFGLSPDNYLYINTASKGLLRNNNPLPQANIARIKLLNDSQSDCLSDNDTEPIESIKLSMGNDIHQITNHDGRVSFYTFDKSADIIINTTSGSYNFCNDTIHIDFKNPSGSIDSISVSGVKVKDCGELSVKFESHSDSFSVFNTSYYFIIQNRGNFISEPTRAIFTFDPNLYDIKFVNFSFADELLQIDEYTYALKINALNPGEVITYTLTARLNPMVSRDYEICSTFYLENKPTQCNTVAGKSVCRNVDKDGRDKTIAIRYFEDTNANCIKDQNEKYINEDIWICVDSTDLIIDKDSVIFYLTGADTIRLKSVYNKDLYKLCQDEYVMPLQKDVFNYNLDIPVKEIKRCAILFGSFASTRFIRCFDNKLYFFLTNSGNTTSSNGTVKITVDDFFEILNIDPLPDVIDGNNYYFSFSPVYVNEPKVFKFECKLNCESSLQQTHCHHMEIMESNPLCNLNVTTGNFCDINIGSYDPNDKTIFVSGKVNETIIKAEDLIEYRIRFQNTGTDTAYTVKIHDPISGKFDVSSIRLIHSTHTCTWKVDNNVLIVDFPGIKLVDSFTNKLGSQGEIRFSIKLLPGREIGETVTNQAQIFFDYNDPVATNKVTSTFGLVSHTNDTTSPAITTLELVPNPATSEVQIKGLSTTIHSDIFVFDFLGRLVYSGKLTNNNEKLKTYSFPEGVYQIVVKEGDVIKVGKLVKM